MSLLKKHEKSHINLLKKSEKINFSKIYSNNLDKETSLYQARFMTIKINFIIFYI